jgi:subtilisin family serine protease
VTIGVIDTGVNSEHESLLGARLEILTVREDDLDPSGRKHGTAVVSLLAGNSDSRVPGLVPEARIVAADPFTDARGDERTDALGLVAAIDAVDQAGAKVVNMSLAGPDNRVLAERIGRTVAAGRVIVAAAGNAGPRSAPLFPAAYDGVIAVTAVDSARRVYRRAVRGPHVDFAAPGVAVGSAASIRGVRPQTGTSFAAPFVTAAAAILVARDPTVTADDIVDRLAASAVDLGDAGRDPVFGHGLIQFGGDCASPQAETGGTGGADRADAVDPRQVSGDGTTRPF